MARWTSYHPVVFLLTFFSYAFFHATRKTFSNVKTTIAAEWTPSALNNSVSAYCTPLNLWNERHLFDTKDDAEKFMGILDASFMFAYAVGLYLSGFVADRHDLRIVLGTGMCLTAGTVFVFGPVFEWTHFYSKYAYVAVWILNGLLQSSGWPSVVAVMGNWFGKSSRGLVLGLWSACASVGNIIGALMVSAVLDYGYEYAFLFTSAVLFAGGIFIFFGLVPSPRDVGLPMPVEGDDQASSSSIQRQPLLDDGDGFEDDDDTAQEPVLYNIEDSRPKAIGFLTALLLPGVVPYALAYAFLKLVNYSFFFWLPFYLSGAYHLPETTADQVSIWYDIGGIVGGTIAGFISDHFQKRAIVVVPMLILAVPMLFVYGLAGIAGKIVVNCVMLYLVGMLIGGVANLISAAISADLGRQKQLQGNSEALSTVTGIIDGTGSLGAAVGQVAVPYLQVSYGWQSVFYLFMVTTFLTAICIGPIFVQEMKDLQWRCLRFSRFRQNRNRMASDDTRGDSD